MNARNEDFEKMTSVTVAFSTFRETRLDWVIDLLRNLGKQTFLDFRVLIVINSNDKYFVSLQNAVNDKNVIDSSFEIDLLPNRVDLGIAHDRNIALKNAKTPYVCFTDDDVIPEIHWLQMLHETLESNEKVAAAVGPVLPIWSVDCGNASLWYPKELFWIIGCTSERINSISPVRNGFGSNMALKRETAIELGGFNEEFGYNPRNNLVGEEPEFGARLIHNGRITLWNPEAKMYHRVTPNRIKFQNTLKRSHAEGQTKAYLRKLLGEQLCEVEVKQLFSVARAIIETRSLKSKALLLASTASVLEGYIESYGKSLR